MKKFLRNWIDDSISLYKSIPLYITIIFVLSLIGMNMLSNITLYQSEFLAIDGGFIFSWVVFLIMDLITIHFGVKGSVKLSIFAVIINLFAALIFYLIGLIPFVRDNSTFVKDVGGTWFILISSSIAFIASAIINSFLNYVIGKGFRKNPDGKLAFISRVYISTLIGQFCDNLIFSTLTFMIFAPRYWNGFCWSFLQCLTCSILFACIELGVEILFSPLGYKISKKWKEKGIGNEYLSKTKI